MTASIASNVNIKSFYYTDHLNHLVIGQVLGIVVDGNHVRAFDQGTVLHYAKADGKFFVQVGVATGNIKEHIAGYYWPTYHNTDAVVHEVVGSQSVDAC